MFAETAVQVPDWTVTIAVLAATALAIEKVLQIAVHAKALWFAGDQVPSEEIRNVSTRLTDLGAYTHKAIHDIQDVAQGQVSSIAVVQQLVANIDKQLSRQETYLGEKLDRQEMISERERNQLASRMDKIESAVGNVGERLAQLAGELQRRQPGGRQ